MKPIHLLVLIPIFSTGCVVTRPLGDAVLSGGGAALASELSHGDPVMTAAGAAGGLLLGEGLNYAGTKSAQKSYLTGYEKGRSDAVKQQYWILIGQQKEKPEEDNVCFYEIPVPEQKIDGAILKPTIKYLRIEE